MKVLQKSLLSAFAGVSVLAASAVQAQEPMPRSIMTRSTLITSDKPAEPVMTHKDAACCDDASDGARRLGLFGDFLYMMPRGTEVTFARTVNSVLPTATPVGPLGIVTDHYSPGVRIGGVWGLDECSALRAEVLWLESHADSSITAPAGAFIQSAVVHPNTLNCASDSLAAAAHTRLELWYGDLDYIHDISASKSGSLSWFAGVRYAHLENDFSSAFTILGATDVATKIDFNGIGPRVGVEGERVSCSGFFGYGCASANFLAGRFKADYLQTNVFAGTQAALHYVDDRIVPILDMELGVGWMNECRRLRISVGYKLDAWFNVLNTQDFINGVQTGNFSGSGDTLQHCFTLDGLVARIAYHF